MQLRLFNLNDDSGEREGLAKRHPEKFARLNAILEREHNCPRQDLICENVAKRDEMFNKETACEK